MNNIHNDNPDTTTAQQHPTSPASCGRILYFLFSIFIALCATSANQKIYYNEHGADPYPVEGKEESLQSPVSGVANEQFFMNAQQQWKTSGDVRKKDYNEKVDGDVDLNELAEIGFFRWSFWKKIRLFSPFDYYEHDAVAAGYRNGYSQLHGSMKRSSRSNFFQLKDHIQGKEQNDNEKHNDSSTGRDKSFLLNILNKIQGKFQLIVRSILTGVLNILFGSIAHEQQLSNFAEITDVVSQSTPRLIALCNLVLAMTYLLHCIVVDIFLSRGNLAYRAISYNNINSSNRPFAGASNNNGSIDIAYNGGSNVFIETLGSYFFFKILLVSAIVEPDALDAFILLIWYTVHTFLRSLAILVGEVVAGSVHRGMEIPNRAVLLLTVISAWNICSGVVCYTLFHTAGAHLLAVLLAECILLCFNLFSTVSIIVSEWNDIDPEQMDSSDANATPNLYTSSSAMVLHAFSSLAILPLPMFKAIFSLSHYLHLWFLHFKIGIVGCIVLGKCHGYARKILREMNNYRKKALLETQLDMLFPDVDLGKLGLQGNDEKSNDVCCICLNALSADAPRGHISSSGTLINKNNALKKLQCGHMYHAQCLRQVVERARSIESAQCPMCRSCIIPTTGVGYVRNAQTTERIGMPQTSTVNRASVVENFMGNTGVDQPVFRFSTEGIFPTWIPLPAFSFEVVRRPNPSIAPALRAGTIIQDAANVNENMIAGTTQTTNTEENSHQQSAQNSNQDEAPINRQQQQQEPGFWSRLFHLFPHTMTEEEERAALNHLSDMFPQFSRDMLLEELQRLGSSQLVVESIFLGRFERNTDVGRNNTENLGNGATGGHVNGIPRDNIMFS